HQRGLARAGGTHDRGEAAFLEGHGHVVEGEDLGVVTAVALRGVDRLGGDRAGGGGNRGGGRGGRGGGGGHGGSRRSGVALVGVESSRSKHRTKTRPGGRPAQVGYWRHPFG